MTRNTTTKRRQKKRSYQCNFFLMTILMICSSLCYHIHQIQTLHLSQLQYSINDENNNNNIISADGRNNNIISADGSAVATAPGDYSSLLWSNLFAESSNTNTKEVKQQEEYDIIVTNTTKRRRRERRRLDAKNRDQQNDDDDEGIVTVPLHSNSGTHHVQMYIGSPPQRQTLIVDTGSRFMAFPCEACRSCGTHVSKHYYSPQLSTTDRTPTCGSCMLKGVSKCSEFNGRCVISQKYTEGSSWTAYELEDLVWLEETTSRMAVPYTFGCQTSEKGLFRKQYADGILGLAVHETSLLQSFYDARSIPNLSFSLCLTREGGSLTVGGTRQTTTTRKQQQREYEYSLEEPVRYTPIARDHGWYALTVERVLLDSVCLAGCDNRTVEDDRILQGFHSGKGTILDSGTTDTYLPQAISERFTQVWTELTHGLPFSNKRRNKYTYAEYMRLPSVSFHFTNNVTITVDPESYMERIGFLGEEEPWVGSKELVNRIYVDEPAGAVLGANTMFGYEIHFDIQEHRVGFAKANCHADVTTII